MARKDISDEMIVCALYLYKQTRWQGRPRFPEALAGITFQPEKVAWAALDRAMGRGLIEFGTSMNFPFLTREGLALAGITEEDDIAAYYRPRGN
jgi:hypothetical protein